MLLGIITSYIKKVAMRAEVRPNVAIQVTFGSN